MIISNPTLNSLRTNFSALFQRGYGRTAPFSDKLCTTVPTSTKIQTYGFLERLPKMRKWVGPRIAQNLKEKAAIIISDPYELTLEVDRDDVEDDNLGQYAMLFEDMGESVACHPDDLTKAALQAGTTNEGFDEVPFFSALHVMGAQAAQANNYTGTALNATNYAAVRASMMSLVGEDGDPLDVQPGLLVVPPQLEGMGRTILNNEYLANGATNEWRNSAQLMVLPKLANQATTWYMFDTHRAIKALIFQQRKKPKFVQKTAETDDNVFFEKKFVYGADCRDNVGYALWWLAARAIA